MARGTGEQSTPEQRREHWGRLKLWIHSQQRERDATACTRLHLKRPPNGLARGVTGRQLIHCSRKPAQNAAGGTAIWVTARPRYRHCGGFGAAVAAKVATVLARCCSDPGLAFGIPAHADVHARACIREVTDRQTPVLVLEVLRYLKARGTRRA